MPLRLGAHTERQGKQQREDHDEANLQRTLSGDEIQNRGGAHQQRNSGENEDEADYDVDAAFAV